MYVSHKKSAFVQAIISTIDPLVCCENLSELNINQVQGVCINSIVMTKFFNSYETACKIHMKQLAIKFVFLLILLLECIFYDE